MLWEQWKAEVMGLRVGGVGFRGCARRSSIHPSSDNPSGVFGSVAWSVVPSGGLEHTKVQVVPHASVAE